MRSAVTVPYRQLMGKLRIPAQAGGLDRFRRRLMGDNRTVPGRGQQVSEGSAHGLPVSP